MEARILHVTNEFYTLKTELWCYVQNYDQFDHKN